MLKWLMEDTTERLLQLALLVIVAATIGFLIYLSQQPPRECSAYANSLMKDVPARCVSYWMNEQ